MSEQVQIEVDQTTQDVTIQVTAGGGLGTVTSVAIQGTDGIQVDSGSPIITNGTIVLGLSPTVLSQLSLAASSIQPGDNLSELVNDVGFLEGVQAGSNISIDNTDPLNPIINATGMGTGTVTSVAISGTDGIEVDSGSPITTSGTIQLGLSSAVLSQLSLASTSLQQSQNLADLASAPAALINLGLNATATEINYTQGVISSIQTQLDGKQDETLDALSVLGRASNTNGLMAAITAGTDGHVLRRSGTSLAFGQLAIGAFADGVITPAKLDNGSAVSVIGRTGLSSGSRADIVAASDHQVLRRNGNLGFGAINLAQAAAVTGLLPDGNISSAATWNAKQDAITGAATTITSTDLTASRALISDLSGKVAVSSVTSTQLGYVDATSSIQTQLDAKANLSGATFTGLVTFDRGGTYPQIGFSASNRFTVGETNPPPGETGSLAAFGSGSNTRNMTFALIKTGVKTTFFGNNGTDLVLGAEGSTSGTMIRGDSSYGAANILDSGNAIARFVLNGSSGVFNLYNTFSSLTNFESIQTSFNSNVGELGTVAGSGGGTVRDFRLTRGGSAHLTLSSSLTTANVPLYVQSTVTAAGTTGNRTINTQSGSVNFAAGASSLTVTSSLATANSIILATVRTDDSNMSSVQVESTSGSFVIYANSPPAAETRVDFFIAA